MTPNTPAVDLDEIAGRVPANYTGAGHFGILISTAERDELVRLARLARVSIRSLIQKEEKGNG